MRLLRIDGGEDDFSLHFEEYFGTKSPDYAILSHTWGEAEVTFKDFRKNLRTGPGYDKIHGCARQALKDGLKYIWVDTCCIDKRSSAELSEAINSMYRWYKDSSICYVCLMDVPDKAWQNSRWLERGWTLQELIAPIDVDFFDRDWTFLFSKMGMTGALATATGIREGVLTNKTRLESLTVCEKMSWSSRRQTTRIEDESYCLLGIFAVNMPLLYGEGDKAFRRLQEMIMQQTNDSSILGWKKDDGSVGLCGEPLTTSPRHFSYIHGRRFDMIPIYDAVAFSKVGVQFLTALAPVPGQMHTYKARLNGAEVNAPKLRAGKHVRANIRYHILVVDLTGLARPGHKESIRRCIRVDASYLGCENHDSFQFGPAEEILLLSVNPASPRYVGMVLCSEELEISYVRTKEIRRHDRSLEAPNLSIASQMHEHRSLFNRPFKHKPFDSQWRTGCYSVCEYRGFMFNIVAGLNRYERPWIRIFKRPWWGEQSMAEWSQADSFDTAHEKDGLRAQIFSDVRQKALCYLIQLDIVGHEADESIAKRWIFAPSRQRIGKNATL